MSEETYVYLGVKPCGCAPRIVVDRPEYAKDTATDVAQYIKDGLTVERVTLEEGRSRLKSCHCNEEPK